jgi:hypothetical protein
MRIFHELVVDDVVSDGNFHLSRFPWMAVLGNFETMRVIVVADGVSGSPNPVMNMVLQETPDNTDTIANTLPSPPNNIISNATLTSGQTNILQGAVGPQDANPASYGYSLVYAIGGTPPFQARIRVWVTGRGRA